MSDTIMTPGAGLKAYLRPRQIAEQYGITERTVRRWMAEGKLDVRRIGRSTFVPVDSVERLFTEGS